MKLIVGLGNPGTKYAKHRHNVGFMAADRLALDHGFTPWRRKFQGQICQGRLGSAKILLLKPETFMNLSGQSVGETMRFHKIAPKEIVVMHDELDLAPGKCRIKTGGGHAGHNGLRSLHQHIGADFTRLRIGIGHPGRKEMVSGYVLHDFTNADQKWLEDVLYGISTGAVYLTEGENAKFLNELALQNKPAKKAPEFKVVKESGTATTDARSLLQKLADRFS